MFHLGKYRSPVRSWLARSDELISYWLGRERVSGICFGIPLSVSVKSLNEFDYSS